MPALAFNTVRAAFGDVPAPRLEILADVDEDTVAARAREFGFARHTTNWQDIISDPAVDVVSITTPNALHKAIALAAIERGKHVYCEKPMALSLEDAEEMADSAQRAGVLTLVGYNYLWNPAIIHAQRLISDGVIGRVVAFRGTFDEDYLADPDLPYSWRCRIAEAGTGALGDMACHLVSAAHHLVGPIEAVMGDIGTEHQYRPGSGSDPAAGGDVETEDMAHALVRFENGVRGMLTSSRIAWGRKNHLAWEVHGSTGMLTFDQERLNELKLFENNGEPSRQGFKTVLSGPSHPPFDQFVPAPGHGLGFNDLKTIEVAHLLRGLAGVEDLHPNFGDALRIERVIHGIVRSARQGRWITVR